MLRTLVLLIAIPLACLSQPVTMALSSGVASPGTSITLTLTLNATEATPVAAQWTLAYAAADFYAITVTASDGAAAAGKTLTCSQTTGATNCVLWGINTTALPNGVAASVALTIAPSSVASSSGIQLVNCMASDAQGNGLAVAAQSGGVTLPQLITANPDPIEVAPGSSLGQTTISWNSPDSSSVEVHVGSGTGPLFAEGGPRGSSQTGDWVTNGMVFVLVDGTTKDVLSAIAVPFDPPPAITETPNPISAAGGAGVGQATINWSAPGYSSVEIHLWSATGLLFASGGATGSSETGNWVTNGMVFVLVDATTHSVLATTTAVVYGPPTITASPNPIPVSADGRVGQTTITWSAPGSGGVQVVLGSVEGQLFASGGPTGSSSTGNWVTNGMVFLLLDATTQTVLATTTVALGQP